MTRPARHLLAVLAAVLAVALPALPTAAAGTSSGGLRVLQSSPSTLRLAFTASGAAADGPLDPSRVTVTFDGYPVHASATPVAARPDAVVRKAVILIDTSGSMAGAGIDGARQAALAYLASLPGDVAVGLVSFSDRPHPLVAPTRDRSALRNAIAGLTAGGETALYDAVGAAVSMLGTTGDRSVVLLSDGGDTRSTSSLTQLVSLLSASGVRVDAVAFRTGESMQATLQRIATASGGRVVNAGSVGEVTDAFSSAARRLASQLLIDVQVPAAAAGRSVLVRVSVPAAAGPATAAVTVALPRAPAPAPAERSVAAPHRLARPVVLLTILFVGLFGLLLVALQALFTPPSDDERTKQLIARYTVRPASAPPSDDAAPAGKLGALALTRPALAVAERWVSRGERKERLAMLLTRGDVSLKPNEWLVVMAGAALAAAVFATAVTHLLLVGAAGGLFAALALHVWLRVKGRRRLAAFEALLPDSLQLIAGSLSSGFSLPQAIAAVVHEGSEPISGELQRALAEARLGVPVEDALDKVADRMDSNDFRWVVMAIRIQREVGGNLAEVLLTTMATMRDRARLRRQVRALSAEGRLSAYILVGLPICMAAYMFAFRRTYISALYTDPLGIVMLVGAVVLVCAGALWMRKIVQVEA